MDRQCLPDLVLFCFHKSNPEDQIAAGRRLIGRIKLLQQLLWLILVGILMVVWQAETKDTIWFAWTAFWVLGLLIFTSYCILNYYFETRTAKLENEMHEEM